MTGTGPQVEPENLATVYPLFASRAGVGPAVGAIFGSQPVLSMTNTRHLLDRQRGGGCTARREAAGTRQYFAHYTVRRGCGSICSRVSAVDSGTGPP